MTREEVIEHIEQLCRENYTDEKYSCAESIVKAFAEVFVPDRYDPKIIPRIATALNGGFAELNLTCGVLTAGMLAIGLVAGRDQPGDEDAKEEAYTITQVFYKRFMEAVGTDSCRVLLDRWHEQGPQKPECKRHTREMAVMLAKLILQMEFHELELEDDKKE